MRNKLNCLLFDDPTSHAITHVGCREPDTSPENQEWAEIILT